MINISKKRFLTGVPYARCTRSTHGAPGNNPWAQDTTSSSSPGKRREKKGKKKEVETGTCNTHEQF